MASFIEDLWGSIFTPGPTPTLLIATNATFAALQFLLLALLIATYSIHFLVLSLLSAGLWYSINWFVQELRATNTDKTAVKQDSREKSLDPESETETEAVLEPKKSSPVVSQQHSTLRPDASASSKLLRKRRSLGDSSDYVSTDSEWEKVSEGEEKDK